MSFCEWKTEPNKGFTVNLWRKLRKIITLRTTNIKIVLEEMDSLSGIDSWVNYFRLHWNKLFQYSRVEKLLTVRKMWRIKEESVQIFVPFWTETLKISSEVPFRNPQRRVIK